MPGLSTRKPSAKHAKRGEVYNSRGVRAKKGEPKPGFTPEELEALMVRACEGLAEAGVYESPEAARTRIEELRAESAANAARVKGVPIQRRA